MSQPQVVTINGQQYVLATSAQVQSQDPPAVTVVQEGRAAKPEAPAIVQGQQVGNQHIVQVQPMESGAVECLPEPVKRPMERNHINVCSAILVIALAAASLEVDWVEVTLRGGTETFTLEDIKDLKGSVYDDIRKQAKLASAGLGVMLAGACVLLVLGVAAYVVRYYKALAFVHLVLPTFLLSLGGLLGALGCGLVIKEAEDLMDTYDGDAEYLEGEYLGFIVSGICFFGGFTLAYFEWRFMEEIHMVTQLPLNR